MQIKGLVVDMFAGGGGASTGIQMALGRSPDVVIDRDERALAMHAANHPGSSHVCADVWRIQPQAITKGKPVSLLWASPECTNHSVAKGGDAKRDSKSRDMPWAVEKFAREVSPNIIIIENVPGFLRWGPCDAKGLPIKAKAGQDFRAFVAKLRKLGYVVDYRLLRADDYGAATIRERLIIIARRDKIKPIWPTPSHGEGRENPFASIKACVNWDRHGRSVLSRRKALGPTTLRRIPEGIRRYDGEPYIATYYGDTKPNDFRGCSINGRIGTQTTANRHALIVPVYAGGEADNADAGQKQVLDRTVYGQLLDSMNNAFGDRVIVDVEHRVLSPRELFNAQGFPPDYVIGDEAEGTLRFTKAAQLRICGNSVCPQVAAALVRANYTEEIPLKPDLPLMAWAMPVLEAVESCTPTHKKCFSHDRVADGKEEWLTPRHLLELIGPFDLDPCAPLVRPWPTAKKHYTIDDDGLLKVWEGSVWLNPPYGPKTGKWLAKLARHGDGIALVFARTETRAFHEHIWPKAHALLFLRGRLTFFNSDGSPGKNTAGAPSVLVAYGEANACRLRERHHMGAFVELRQIPKNSASFAGSSTLYGEKLTSSVSTGRAA